MEITKTDSNINQIVSNIRQELQNSFPDISDIVHGILITKNNKIISFNKSIENTFFSSQNKDLIGEDICAILPPSLIDMNITHNKSTEIYTKLIDLEIGNNEIIKWDLYSFTIEINNIEYKTIAIPYLQIINKLAIQTSINLNNKITEINKHLEDIENSTNRADFILSSSAYLMELSNADIVVFSRIVHDRTIIVENIYTRKHKINFIEEYLKNQINNLSLTLNDDALELYNKKKLLNGPLSISELTFGKINYINEIDNPNLLKFNEVQIMGIHSANRLIGSVSLFSYKNKLINTPLSELFINLISNSFQIHLPENNPIINYDIFDFANNCPLPLTISDNKENFIFINNKFGAFLGYNSYDLKDKSIRQISNRVEFDNFLTNTYLRKKRISDIYTSSLLNSNNIDTNVIIMAAPIFEKEIFKGVAAIFFNKPNNPKNEQNNSFPILSNFDEYNYPIIAINNNKEIIYANNNSLSHFNTQTAKNTQTLHSKDFNAFNLRINYAISKINISENYIIFIEFPDNPSYNCYYFYFNNKDNYSIFLFPFLYKPIEINEINLINVDYKSALNKTPLGQLIIDIQSKNIIDTNNQFELYTGYSKKEIINKPFNDLFVNTFENKLINYHEQMFQEVNNAHNIKFETIIKTKQSGNKPVHICINILSNKNLFLISIIDSSENLKLKNSLLEIQDTNRNLENLNNSIITNISNNIKEPLNSIYNQIILINNERNSSKRNSIANDLLTHLSVASKTIETLINISKIEANQSNIISEEIHINNMLSNIKKSTIDKIKYAKNSIEIEIIIDPIINKYSFTSSYSTIYQIFEIILSNLIETQRGGLIQINVLPNNNKSIEFSIKYFSKEPKYNLSNDYNKTGIFFYETTNQYNLLQYKYYNLLINSISGNTFYKISENVHEISFKLPNLLTSHNIYINPVKPLNISNKKIMIISKNNDLYNKITKVMSNENNVFQLIQDGLNAIKVLNKSTYDLLIIDMDIEGFDGLETMWLIKHKNIKVKVISLFNLNNPRIKEKCMKLGCFDYLTKPLNESIMTHKINRALNS